MFPFSIFTTNDSSLHDFIFFFVLLLSHLKWNFHVLMWPLFSSHAVFLLTLLLLCLFALSLQSYSLFYITFDYLLSRLSINNNINILFLMYRYLLFLSTSPITLSSPIYFLLFLSPLYSNLLVATYQSAVCYCWPMSSFIICYYFCTTSVWPILQYYRVAIFCFWSASTLYM